MSQSTTEVREAITTAIEKFMAACNQGDAAGSPKSLQLVCPGYG